MNFKLLQKGESVSVMLDGGGEGATILVEKMYQDRQLSSGRFYTLKEFKYSSIPNDIQELLEDVRSQCDE